MQFHTRGCAQAKENQGGSPIDCDQISNMYNTNHIYIIFSE